MYVLCVSALECLKPSHTIICWSFEFLDVVVGEVSPQRVLSTRHLTRMWNTAGKQNYAAADLLLLKLFSIVLPVESWRYRSVPVSFFCAISLLNAGHAENNFKANRFICW